MHRFAFAVLMLLSAGCSGNEPQGVVQSTLPTTYGKVPDFSLTESGGATITRDDLAGKVWIADFIFTSCAGTCPSMTGKMRVLQNTLPPEIQLVSFTVDPNRDTPQVLSQYADHFGADRNRWLFLTGPQEDVYKLSIEGFKLALMETGGSAVEPITHSTRFVLVDKMGEIRGYFGSTDAEDMERLVREAKELL